MDFSKEYIRMCEKAYELQKQHNKKSDDIIVEKSPKYICKILTREVYDNELPKNYKEFCVFSENERKRKDKEDGYYKHILVDNGEFIKWWNNWEYKYSKPRLRHLMNPLALYNSDVSWIVLFRQDQLQEIVRNDGGIWEFIKDFEVFVQSTKNTDGETMEQLWLDYVMKEKYNKIWTRKEWYKE